MDYRLMMDILAGGLLRQTLAVRSVLGSVAVSQTYMLVAC